MATAVESFQEMDYDENNYQGRRGNDETKAARGRFVAVRADHCGRGDQKRYAGELLYTPHHSRISCRNRVFRGLHLFIKWLGRDIPGSTGPTVGYLGGNISECLCPPVREPSSEVSMYLANPELFLSYPWTLSGDLARQWRTDSSTTINDEKTGVNP
jgi:hypothetical protein